MKNRFLSFLIIVFVFIFGLIYIIYFFVPDQISQKQIIEQNQNKKEVFLKEISLSGSLNDYNKKYEKSKTFLEFEKNILKRFNFSGKEFLFIQNDLSISFFSGDILVYKFDLVPKSLIDMEKIYSDKNSFFISIGNKKYIFNDKTKNIYNLDIFIPIIYTKKSLEKYIIYTNKGSFIFDTLDNSLDYFSFFDDFIYFKDYYVGIIKKDDFQRRKNLSISDNKNSLIYIYKPENKEKRIILSTNKLLEKIYFNDGKIYIQDNKNKTYFLENFFG